jgi:UDP-glucose 4-epimerase
MKILVTGGAGFIGSNIVDAYIGQGHDVTIVDDLSSGKKANVNPRAQFHAMDIRDPNISSLFEKSSFEVVNHHAAQIDVRKSVQDPFLDASINILGTLRLLECCRAYAVKKIIFSSSGGTIYGECRQGPATEESPERPESPYGFSKAGAETYIRFYGSMFGIGYTILRYSNVYGPRQDPHGEAGVVAIFAGKLLAGQPVTIFGTGQQVRDYVYVKDVVEANLAALSKGTNDTFNIATQQPTSVNALYEIMSRLAPKASPPTHAAARAGELTTSVLNHAKAARGLGWTPKRTLEQGLAETYQYFHDQA